MSLAIGKSGQNSRLAVQLTGWGLDIITEAQYQERRVQQELIQQHFRKLDGISELMALSLSTSGFDSIKSIAEASMDLLKTVPGLEEEETAQKLQQTAQRCLDEGGDKVDVLPEVPKVESEEAEKTPLAQATAKTELQQDNNVNEDTLISSEDDKSELENTKADPSENNVETN